MTVEQSLHCYSGDARTILRFDVHYGTGEHYGTATCVVETAVPANKGIGSPEG